MCRSVGKNMYFFFSLIENAKLMEKVCYVGCKCRFGIYDLTSNKQELSIVGQ